MIGEQKIKVHKATLYRTSHYSPEQIKHLRESANRQEKIIARWYFAHPAGESPTWLHNEIDPEWLLTSTRRALTNLTDDGILVKTERVKTSVYGKTEHIWRWRTHEDEPVVPAQSELFASKGKGAYSQ